MSKIITQFFEDLTKENTLCLTVNHHTKDWLNIEQLFDGQPKDQLYQQCMETGCVFSRPALFFHEASPHQSAPNLLGLFKEETPSSVKDFLKALNGILLPSFRETEKCRENYHLRVSLELSIVPRHEFYCDDKKEFILEELEDCDTSNISEETKILFIANRYHNPNSYSTSIATSPEDLFQSMVGWGLDERKLDPSLSKELPPKWQILLFETIQNHQWDDHYGPIEDYRQLWHDTFSDMIKKELPQKGSTLHIKKM